MKNTALDQLSPEGQEKVRRLVAERLMLDKLKQMNSASKAKPKKDSEPPKNR